MLYTDIPTNEELQALDAERGPACVSIFLPTHAVTAQAEGDRIQYKNLVSDALGQLESAGTEKRLVAAVKEELEALEKNI